MRTRCRHTWRALGTAVVWIWGIAPGTGAEAEAQYNASARALALSGSIVADAQGLEAAAWNPADLARRKGARQVDLVGLSTRARNNSFSVSDYNRYTGATLDEDDKAYILEQIPESGLRLNADAGAQAMSVWSAPLAVTLSSTGAAYGNLSRDAVALLLYGNASFDSVQLSGTGGATYAVVSVGFSYAHPVAVLPTGDVNAGATVRYVKGLFVEELTESYGEILTTDQGIFGDARLAGRTAQGGTGVAADLGLSYAHGEHWRFGAAVTNLIGTVHWSGSPEAFEYSFTVDSLSVVNADRDSLISSHDSTYAIEGFSTRLPATLRVGASRSQGATTWTAQWEQALNGAPGRPTSPHLAGGVEWWASSMFPLRAGLSVGGGRGVGLSGGSGIRQGLFYLDLGFGLSNGLTWGGAKGIELALNTGFRF